MERSILISDMAGAFYALADAAQFGLDVRSSRARDLSDIASAITRSVKSQIPLNHPDDDDLAFLYGTILTDGRDTYSDQATANVCVFADAQIDRSPTGSGVTARLAVQHAKGLINTDQSRRFASVTGAEFEGIVEQETTCGPRKAIRARVAGRSFYSGSCHFVHEPEDFVGEGFLLR